MLPITKYLTTANYTKMNNKKNDYIVIHYVGAVSSAKNNAIYYHTGDKNASANYFVDDTSIYQVVEDSDKAWHCGGGLQGTGGHKYFQICTNSNSIGIEMCLDKANHISDKTIANVADLVQSLMKKYNIPFGKVIRHYDVTGKLCPAMYIDETKWNELKKILTGANTDISTPTKPTTKSDDWIKKLQKSIGTTVDGIADLDTLAKTPTIKKGSKGDMAKLLQEKLTALGYDTKGVDGEIGDNSVIAIKAYQKKVVGISNPDGEFTAKGASWKKLLGL